MAIVIEYLKCLVESLHSFCWSKIILVWWILPILTKTNCFHFTKIHENFEAKRFIYLINCKSILCFVLQSSFLFKWVFFLQCWIILINSIIAVFVLIVNLSNEGNKSYALKTSERNQNLYVVKHFGKIHNGTKINRMKI